MGLAGTYKNILWNKLSQDNIQENEGLAYCHRNSGYKDKKCELPSYAVFQG